MLDDFNHYIWTFPLTQKSEVLPLIDFLAYVLMQFQLPILALQTDNGRDFDSIAVHALLARHNTQFRLSRPYTSQQNGRAERAFRTLNDGVHALL